jgi:hypothetical protein
VRRSREIARGARLFSDKNAARLEGLAGAYSINVSSWFCGALPLPSLSHSYLDVVLSPFLIANVPKRDFDALNVSPTIFLQCPTTCLHPSSSAGEALSSSHGGGAR